MDKTTAATTDQIRAQYAANAKGLRSLLIKAERTGKKANGFTATDLRDKVATYERLSTASDADLRAHLADAKIRIRERLAVLKSAHVS